MSVWQDGAKAKADDKADDKADTKTECKKKSSLDANGMYAHISCVSAMSRCISISVYYVCIHLPCMYT